METLKFSVKKSFLLWVWSQIIYTRWQFKRWNNKNKYLVFYIITKMGNSYTNWNVFLVFSCASGSHDRCCEEMWKFEVFHVMWKVSKVLWKTIERRWKARGKWLITFSRVLIYVIFSSCFLFVFENAPYDREHSTPCPPIGVWTLQASLVFQPFPMKFLHFK